MLRRKKTFVLMWIGACVWGSFSFAQDELFENIQKGLEKPSTVEKKPYFLADFFHSATQAKNYIAYKEAYLSGRYSNDLEKIGGRNSAGFLLFGTFPGAEGQLGDLNVQGRLAYYNDQFAHGMLMPCEYTKRVNQMKAEFHNAYARFRAAPPMCNVRVGHFYVPFGIQPWIDTHGTLLQGPTMEFIGVERDWGISLDGQNEKLEYQAGLTRGSGMEYFNRSGNYIVAGKLSTPRIGQHVNDWLGISCLAGRVFDPEAKERWSHLHIHHNIVPRWRLGIDGQKIWGASRLRFEITGGKDAGRANVLGEFFELKYVLDTKNRWNTYLQFENLTQIGSLLRKKSDTTLRWGLTYTLSANYNLQFVASRDVKTMWGRRDTWVGLLLYGQLGFR